MFCRACMKPKKIMIDPEPYFLYNFVEKGCLSSGYERMKKSMTDDVYSPDGERYEEMLENSRDDEHKDFTALVKMLQRLHHNYHRTKEEAMRIARAEGNWSERDIQSAANMVYDMGM